MSFYRNAYYWFCLLLAVSILGFWRSYFSQWGQGTVDLAHHAHGLAMLLWIAMLITQSWLIRTRRNPMHRTLGRTSLVLAPIVVVTGIWVNLHFMRGREGPYPDELISIYWFGFFLALSFGVLHTLAIVYRRRVQLHARYGVQRPVDRQSRDVGPQPPHGRLASPRGVGGWGRSAVRGGGPCC